ncbi:hypothetical protein ABI_29380 [Asticcacaulis biprosthecium C19]|uniref:Uncharacterized protein n=1 Tax=Asticcacaulis biprosthecium C19 TaxID=715226 RepID=F4QMT0_9CAUL|nr:hypothetical protein [Asticcacaulis biprosthecium]EGF91521.1 hypothetical protein ABI_29380 [Asticcacaulis biprosthecium C19]
MLDDKNPETDLDLDEHAGDEVGDNILNEDEDQDLDDDVDDENDEGETGIGVIDDLSNGDTDSENETGTITPAL